jgi:hypothetical protein
MRDRPTGRTQEARVYGISQRAQERMKSKLIANEHPATAGFDRALKILHASQRATDRLLDQEMTTCLGRSDSDVKVQRGRIAHHHRVRPKSTQREFDVRLDGEPMQLVIGERTLPSSEQHYILLAEGQQVSQVASSDRAEPSD